MTMSKVLINILSQTHHKHCLVEEEKATIDCFYKTLLQRYQTPIYPLISSHHKMSSIQIGDGTIDAFLRPSITDAYFPMIKSTLLYGPFGTGKSLFAIQSALHFIKEDSEQIVAFFSTDGPFPSKRLFQLYQSNADHSFMDRFFIFEIRTLTEFISFIFYFLPTWNYYVLSKEILIIVDNLTSLIRFSDDFDQFTVDFPKAVHFAKTKLSCRFLFLSQIKPIISNPDFNGAVLTNFEAYAPAIHSSLYLHGHFFDQQIRLDTTGPTSNQLKQMTISTGIVEPKVSLHYTIDELKGITFVKQTS